MLLAGRKAVEDVVLIRLNNTTDMKESSSTVRGG
jgi:hypothetical protein